MAEEYKSAHLDHLQILRIQLIGRRVTDEAVTRYLSNPGDETMKIIDRAFCKTFEILEGVVFQGFCEKGFHHIPRCVCVPDICSKHAHVPWPPWPKAKD